MTAFCVTATSEFALLLILTAVSVEGQYDDVRCKCVCPSVTQTNSSAQSRKIFVKSFHEPSKCKCENVVDQWVQESQYHFCERCDCQWQRRNTTTIKVVVIFIICIISLLFLYMVFLLCLDPLMSRRPVAYTEQHNEEDQPVADRRRELEDSRPVPPGVMSRVKNKVCSVRGEQQKWKGTVQEQRKHIYDRHTMLN